MPPDQLGRPPINIRRGDVYARIAVSADGLQRALDELGQSEENWRLRDELLTYIRSTGWGAGLP